MTLYAWDGVLQILLKVVSHRLVNASRSIWICEAVPEFSKSEVDSMFNLSILSSWDFMAFSFT